MGELYVRFWGVRGSLPSPDPASALYGGNTPCVEVRAGDQLFVLDMGSGLRPLGESLVVRPLHATFLLSHYHWDHIQGLPFFAPAFDPRCSFEVVGPVRNGQNARALLSGQMVAPYFPVPFESFRAPFSFRDIAGGQTLEFGAVRVTAAEMNHPNGSLAYRIELDGHALVYATDTEHGSEADDRLVEMAKGAEGLIYDAMYTPAEYNGDGASRRAGWGHSTWEAATDIARRAGVKKLVLFHHDPNRSDVALEQVLKLARERFETTILARERALVRF